MVGARSTFILNCSEITFFLFEQTNRLPSQMRPITKMDELSEETNNPHLP